jgi:hypothetical protein
MIVDFRIQWVNFLCGQVTHVRHAMQLIGIEVERANSLFPNDESEAVCELLRRSHENPEKRAWLKASKIAF